MSNRIYLDNAASTPLLPQVLDSIVNVLEHHYGNPSSIHSNGRKSRTIIEKARKTIANSLHCSIGEIFFTSGASESNNTILFGAVNDLKVNHIIYSAIEHPSVLKTIEKLVELGKVSATKVPVNKYGSIDMEFIESSIVAMLSKGKIILVSVMFVNNEIGSIQPMSDIAELCDRHKVLLHTDAVQALGKYEIDLSVLPISFLSASAHKFHGPKGVGFFYMKMDNIVNPLIYGGAQERNMRSGTENTAYIHGMATAFDLACNEMDERANYVSQLRDYLVSEVKSKIENVEILGHPDAINQQYSICNISFAPHPRNEMMMMNLDVAGISASGGSACSSGIEYVSHVLEAIKVGIDRTAIRFSLSPLNTKEEIDTLVAVLIKLQAK